MVSVQVIKFLLCGLVISGVLQLAGFVSPGWVRTRNKGNSVQKGLFYEVECADTCKITSVNKNYDGNYNIFRPWQIQTSIALAACVIAFVGFITVRQRTGTGVLKPLIIAVYFSLLSGILSLVPAGIFADIQMSSDNGRLLFSYSVLLTGLGGILALIISLIPFFYN